ncbi:hypothetical protein [Pseudomonas fluorescens]|uniref:hypothetical protein n=1 Tax=Pseudomonas fluorescens TaxID=294 RepID=UPI00068DD015|nr:hypothetical protein [Pseudomonas fluorescens]
MDNTGQERSAKAALKRIEFDENELRHRCRLGTRQKLEALKVRHEIVIIEKVAREFRNQSLNEISKIPADEIIELNWRLIRQCNRQPIK